MEASRGKKGKKGRWLLTLGLKEAIFAGLGIAGLIMMSFALGTLAGRGDIYRVLSHWGLLAPDAARLAQWSPPGGAPAPSTASSAAAPAATTASASATGVAKPEAATPVTGSLAAVPASTSPQKKSKGAANQKAKEEELRKVRQEVVGKLRFQNSFDTPPKPQAASKPQPSQVRVAQFRDSKAAKAKMTELQKKGVKVTLKQTKDSKGPLYTIYKQVPADQQEAQKVAEKKAKPQAE